MRFIYMLRRWAGWAVLVLTMVACGQTASEALPRPTLTSTRPLPPTITPAPTATWTPTPTPSPTPIPPLTWDNPWTGETISVSPRCQTPEIQAFIAWAQEHPTALAEAVVAHLDDQIQRLGIPEVQGFAGDNEWETSAIQVKSIETDPPSQALVIGLPALLLGLNQRYDYPELGLTVFTACALIWDNDLAQRVSSWAETSNLPENELGLRLLTRDDPEEATPHWYVGEVAVAYVLLPNSPLIHEKPIVGERRLYAWEAFTLYMGGSGGISEGGFKHTTPYEVYVFGGCYYPYSPSKVDFQTMQQASPEQRENLWDSTAPVGDPYCRRLEETLSLYNQWVGEASLFLSSLWGEVEALRPWLTLAPQDEVNFDLEVTPIAKGDQEAERAALQGWVETFFADPLELDPDAELLLMDEPAALSYEATLFALSHLLEMWPGSQAAGLQTCSPLRALAQYKLDTIPRSRSCPLDTVAQQTVWGPTAVVVFDGDLWSGGIRFPLETLLALQEE